MAGTGSRPPNVRLATPVAPVHPAAMAALPDFESLADYYAAAVCVAPKDTNWICELDFCVEDILSRNAYQSHAEPFGRKLQCTAYVRPKGILSTLASRKAGRQRNRTAAATHVAVTLNVSPQASAFEECPACLRPLDLVHGNPEPFVSTVAPADGTKKHAEIVPDSRPLRIDRHTLKLRPLPSSNGNLVDDLPWTSMRSGTLLKALCEKAGKKISPGTTDQPHSGTGTKSEQEASSVSSPVSIVTVPFDPESGKCICSLGYSTLLSRSVPWVVPLVYYEIILVNLFDPSASIVRWGVTTFSHLSPTKVIIDFVPRSLLQRGFLARRDTALFKVRLCSRFTDPMYRQAPVWFRENAALAHKDLLPEGDTAAADKQKQSLSNKKVIGGANLQRTGQLSGNVGTPIVVGSGKLSKDVNAQSYDAFASGVVSSDDDSSKVTDILEELDGEGTDCGNSRSLEFHNDISCVPRHHCLHSHAAPKRWNLEHRLGQIMGPATPPYDVPFCKGMLGRCPDSWFASRGTYFGQKAAQRRSRPGTSVRIRPPGASTSFRALEPCLHPILRMDFLRVMAECFPFDFVDVVKSVLYYQRKCRRQRRRQMRAEKKKQRRFHRERYSSEKSQHDEQGEKLESSRRLPWVTEDLHVSSYGTNYGTWKPGSDTFQSQKPGAGTSNGEGTAAGVVEDVAEALAGGVAESIATNESVIVGSDVNTNVKPAEEATEREKRAYVRRAVLEKFKKNFSGVVSKSKLKAAKLERVLSKEKSLRAVDDDTDDSSGSDTTSYGDPRRRSLQNNWRRGSNELSTHSCSLYCPSHTGSLKGRESIASDKPELAHLREQHLHKRRKNVSKWDDLSNLSTTSRASGRSTTSDSSSSANFESDASSDVLRQDDPFRVSVTNCTSEIDAYHNFRRMITSAQFPACLPKTVRVTCFTGDTSASESSSELCSDAASDRSSNWSSDFLGDSQTADYIHRSTEGVLVKSDLIAFFDLKDEPSLAALHLQLSGAVQGHKIKEVRVDRDSDIVSEPRAEKPVDSCRGEKKIVKSRKHRHFGGKIRTKPCFHKARRLNRLFFSSSDGEANRSQIPSDVKQKLASRKHSHCCCHKPRECTCPIDANKESTPSIDRRRDNGTSMVEVSTLCVFLAILVKRIVGSCRETPTAHNSKLDMFLLVRVMTALLGMSTAPDALNMTNLIAVTVPVIVGAFHHCYGKAGRKMVETRRATTFHYKRYLTQLEIQRQLRLQHITSPFLTVGAESVTFEKTSDGKADTAEMSLENIKTATLPVDKLRRTQADAFSRAIPRLHATWSVRRESNLAATGTGVIFAGVPVARRTFARLLEASRSEFTKRFRAARLLVYETSTSHSERDHRCFENGDCDHFGDCADDKTSTDSWQETSSSGNGSMNDSDSDSNYRQSARMNTRAYLGFTRLVRVEGWQSWLNRLSGKRDYYRSRRKEVIHARQQKLREACRLSADWRCSKSAKDLLSAPMEDLSIASVPSSYEAFAVHRVTRVNEYINSLLLNMATALYEDSRPPTHYHKSTSTQEVGEKSAAQPIDILQFIRISSSLMQRQNQMNVRNRSQFLRETYGNRIAALEIPCVVQQNAFNDAENKGNHRRIAAKPRLLFAKFQRNATHWRPHSITDIICEEIVDEEDGRSTGQMSSESQPDAAGWKYTQVDADFLQDLADSTTTQYIKRPRIMRMLLRWKGLDPSSRRFLSCPAQYIDRLEQGNTPACRFFTRRLHASLSNSHVMVRSTQARKAASLYPAGSTSIKCSITALDVRRRPRAYYRRSLPVNRSTLKPTNSGKTHLSAKSIFEEPLEARALANPSKKFFVSVKDFVEEWTYLLAFIEEDFLTSQKKKRRKSPPLLETLRSLLQHQINAIEGARDFLRARVVYSWNQFQEREEEEIERRKNLETQHSLQVCRELLGMQRVRCVFEAVEITKFRLLDDVDADESRSGSGDEVMVRDNDSNEESPSLLEPDSLLPTLEQLQAVAKLPSPMLFSAALAANGSLKGLNAAAAALCMIGSLPPFHHRLLQQELAHVSKMQGFQRQNRGSSQQHPWMRSRPSSPEDCNQKNLTYEERRPLLQMCFSVDENVRSLETLIEEYMKVHRVKGYNTISMGPQDVELFRRIGQAPPVFSFVFQHPSQRFNPITSFTVPDVLDLSEYVDGGNNAANEQHMSEFQQLQQQYQNQTNGTFVVDSHSKRKHHKTSVQPTSTTLNDNAPRSKTGTTSVRNCSNPEPHTCNVPFIYRLYSVLAACPSNNQPNSLLSAPLCSFTREHPSNTWILVTDSIRGAMPLPQSRAFFDWQQRFVPCIRAARGTHPIGGIGGSSGEELADAFRNVLLKKIPGSLIWTALTKGELRRGRKTLSEVDISSAEAGPGYNDGLEAEDSTNPSSPNVRRRTKRRRGGARGLVEDMCLQLFRRNRVPLLIADFPTQITVAIPRGGYSFRYIPPLPESSFIDAIMKTFRMHVAVEIPPHVIAAVAAAAPQIIGSGQKLSPAWLGGLARGPFSMLTPAVDLGAATTGLIMSSTALKIALMHLRQRRTDWLQRWRSLVDANGPLHLNSPVTGQSGDTKRRGDSSNLPGMPPQVCKSGVYGVAAPGEEYRSLSSRRQLAGIVPPPTANSGTPVLDNYCPPVNINIIEKDPTLLFGSYWPFDRGFVPLRALYVRVDIEEQLLDMPVAEKLPPAPPLFGPLASLNGLVIGASAVNNPGQLLLNSAGNSRKRKRGQLFEDGTAPAKGDELYNDYEADSEEYDEEGLLCLPIHCEIEQLSVGGRNHGTISVQKEQDGGGVISVEMSDDEPAVVPANGPFCNCPPDSNMKSGLVAEPVQCNHCKGWLKSASFSEGRREKRVVVDPVTVALDGLPEAIAAKLTTEQRKKLDKLVLVEQYLNHLIPNAHSRPSREVSSLRRIVSTCLGAREFCATQVLAKEKERKRKRGLFDFTEERSDSGNPYSPADPVADDAVVTTPKAPINAGKIDAAEKSHGEGTEPAQIPTLDNLVLRRLPYLKSDSSNEAGDFSAKDDASRSEPEWCETSVTTEETLMTEDISQSYLWDWDTSWLSNCAYHLEYPRREGYTLFTHDCLMRNLERHRRAKLNALKEGRESEAGPSKESDCDVHIQWDPESSCIVQANRDKKITVTALDEGGEDELPVPSAKTAIFNLSVPLEEGDLDMEARATELKLSLSENICDCYPIEPIYVKMAPQRRVLGMRDYFQKVLSDSSLEKLSSNDKHEVLSGWTLFQLASSAEASSIVDIQVMTVQDFLDLNVAFDSRCERSARTGVGHGGSGGSDGGLAWTSEFLGTEMPSAYLGSLWRDKLPHTSWIRTRADATLKEVLEAVPPAKLLRRRTECKYALSAMEGVPRRKFIEGGYDRLLYGVTPSTFNPRDLRRGENEVSRTCCKTICQSQKKNTAEQHLDRHFGDSDVCCCAVLAYSRRRRETWKKLLKRPSITLRCSRKCSLVKGDDCCRLRRRRCRCSDHDLMKHESIDLEAALEQSDDSNDLLYSYGSDSNAKNSLEMLSKEKSRAAKKLKKIFSKDGVCRQSCGGGKSEVQEIEGNERGRKDKLKKIRIKKTAEQLKHESTVRAKLLTKHLNVCQSINLPVKNLKEKLRNETVSDDERSCPSAKPVWYLESRPVYKQRALNRLDAYRPTESSFGLFRLAIGLEAEVDRTDISTLVPPPMVMNADDDSPSNNGSDITSTPTGKRIITAAFAELAARCPQYNVEVLHDIPPFGAVTADPSIIKVGGKIAPSSVLHDDLERKRLSDGQVFEPGPLSHNYRVTPRPIISSIQDLNVPVGTLATPYSANRIPFVNSKLGLPFAGGILVLIVAPRIDLHEAPPSPSTANVAEDPMERHMWKPPIFSTHALRLLAARERLKDKTRRGHYAAKFRRRLCRQLIHSGGRSTRVGGLGRLDMRLHKDRDLLDIDFDVPDPPLNANCSDIDSQEIVLVRHNTIDALSSSSEKQFGDAAVAAMHESCCRTLINARQAKQNKDASDSTGEDILNLNDWYSEEERLVRKRRKCMRPSCGNKLIPRKLHELLGDYCYYRRISALKKLRNQRRLWQKCKSCGKYAETRSGFAREPSKDDECESDSKLSSCSYRSYSGAPDRTSSSDVSFAVNVPKKCADKKCSHVVRRKKNSDSESGQQQNKKRLLRRQRFIMHRAGDLSCYYGFGFGTRHLLSVQKHIRYWPLCRKLYGPPKVANVRRASGSATSFSTVSPSDISLLRKPSSVLCCSSCGGCHCNERIVTFKFEPIVESKEFFSLIKFFDCPSLSVFHLGPAIVESSLPLIHLGRWVQRRAVLWLQRSTDSQRGNIWAQGRSLNISLRSMEAYDKAGDAAQFAVEEQKSTPCECYCCCCRRSVERAALVEAYRVKDGNKPAIDRAHRRLVREFVRASLERYGCGDCDCCLQKRPNAYKTTLKKSGGKDKGMGASKRRLSHVDVPDVTTVDSQNSTEVATSKNEENKKTPSSENLETDGHRLGPDQLFSPAEPLMVFAECSPRHLISLPNLLPMTDHEATLNHGLIFQRRPYDSSLNTVELCSCCGIMLSTPNSTGMMSGVNLGPESTGLDALTENRNCSISAPSRGPETGYGSGMFCSSACSQIGSFRSRMMLWQNCFSLPDNSAPPNPCDDMLQEDIETDDVVRKPSSSNILCPVKAATQTGTISAETISSEKAADSAPPSSSSNDLEDSGKGADDKINNDGPNSITEPQKKESEDVSPSPESQLAQTLASLNNLEDIDKFVLEEFGVASEEKTRQTKRGRKLPRKVARRQQLSGKDVASSNDISSTVQKKEEKEDINLNTGGGPVLPDKLDVPDKLNKAVPDKLDELPSEEHKDTTEVSGKEALAISSVKKPIVKPPRCTKASDISELTMYFIERVILFCGMHLLLSVPAKLHPLGEATIGWLATATLSITSPKDPNPTFFPSTLASMFEMWEKEVALAISPIRDQSLFTLAEAGAVRTAMTIFRKEGGLRALVRRAIAFKKYSLIRSFKATKEYVLEKAMEDENLETSQPQLFTAVFSYLLGALLSDTHMVEVVPTKPTKLRLVPFERMNAVVLALLSHVFITIYNRAAKRSVGDNAVEDLMCDAASIMYHSSSCMATLPLLLRRQFDLSTSLQQLIDVVARRLTVLAADGRPATETLISEVQQTIAKDIRALELPLSDLLAIFILSAPSSVSQETPKTELKEAKTGGTAEKLGNETQKFRDALTKATNDGGGDYGSAPGGSGKRFAWDALAFFAAEFRRNVRITRVACQNAVLATARGKRTPTESVQNTVLLYWMDLEDEDKAISRHSAPQVSGKRRGKGGRTPTTTNTVEDAARAAVNARLASRVNADLLRRSFDYTGPPARTSTRRYIVCGPPHIESAEDILMCSVQGHLDMSTYSALFKEEPIKKTDLAETRPTAGRETSVKSSLTQNSARETRPNEKSVISPERSHQSLARSGNTPSSSSVVGSTSPPSGVVKETTKNTTAPNASIPPVIKTSVTSVEVDNTRGGQQTVKDVEKQVVASESISHDRNSHTNKSDHTPLSGQQRLAPATGGANNISPSSSNAVSVATSPGKELIPSFGEDVSSKLRTLPLKQNKSQQSLSQQTSPNYAISPAALGVGADVLVHRLYQKTQNPHRTMATNDAFQNPLGSSSGPFSSGPLSSGSTIPHQFQGESFLQTRLWNQNEARTPSVLDRSNLSSASLVPYLSNSSTLLRSSGLTPPSDLGITTNSLQEEHLFSANRNIGEPRTLYPPPFDRSRNIFEPHLPWCSPEPQLSQGFSPQGLRMASTSTTPLVPPAFPPPLSDTVINSSPSLFQLTKQETLPPSLPPSLPPPRDILEDLTWGNGGGPNASSLLPPRYVFEDPDWGNGDRSSVPDDHLIDQLLSRVLSDSVKNCNNAPNSAPANYVDAFQRPQANMPQQLERGSNNNTMYQLNQRPSEIRHDAQEQNDSRQRVANFLARKAEEKMDHLNQDHVDLW